VDLCRQCIVFENLQDIAKCMMFIRGDADIKVVRVKNRFDPHYASSTSAGYRDVGINLQIVTDKTVQDGLAGHICEVQLLYKPFAEFKVMCTNVSCMFLLL